MKTKTENSICTPKTVECHLLFSCLKNALNIKVNVKLTGLVHSYMVRLTFNRKTRLF